MSSEKSGAIKAVITKDDRRANKWVEGKATGGITFSAKMFDDGSQYGVNNGRVSKLDIRKDGRIIVNFDRGWDVKPQTAEHKAVYKSVMAALNALGKEADIDESGRRDFLGVIEANKGKVSHDRTFAVTITETLKMTVEVEAASREEAEQIASDNWRNSEYILDADSFAGVEFEAAPAKRERSKGGELC